MIKKIQLWTVMVTGLAVSSLSHAECKHFNVGAFEAIQIELTCCMVAIMKHGEQVKRGFSKEEDEKLKTIAAMLSQIAEDVASADKTDARMAKTMEQLKQIADLGTNEDFRKEKEWECGAIKLFGTGNYQAALDRAMALLDRDFCEGSYSELLGSLKNLKQVIENSQLASQEAQGNDNKQEL